VRRELERRPLQDGAWHLVAVGKAAGAMAQGAVDVLGARVAGGCLVLPPGHLPAGFAAGAHGLQTWIAAHPVPDEHSLAAGEGVANYVSSLPVQARLLFMVSGGASSLLEWLRPGVSLAELQEFNRWALQSGLPIGAVNGLRGRLSRLKGGGLAQLAGARRAYALLVSDVPGDDPRVIGSGLLHAPRPGPMSASEVELPAHLRALFARAASTSSTTNEVRRIPTRIVASARLACAAAAAAATAQGLTARVGRRRYAGDAATLGRRFARELMRLPAGTVFVRGGESTVRLPPAPGRGGRNQHLALAAAIELERCGVAGPCLLAAGTDGIDGASPDAGAVVDAGTCARARDGGFDPRVSLAHADSGSLLEASGDLLHTGATLTNVGDLVLALNPGAAR
jgi:hydroxypyruvate reductase